jgi:outer membrane protein assembly factor BamB
LALCGASANTLSAQGNRPAANWPRFRGPTGDGVSSEKNLPLKWSDTSNIVWKTTLPGAGASSPVTFGDRIYVTCYSNYGVPGEPRGKLEELKKHLVCLNRADGRIVWNTPITNEFVEHPYGDYVNRHGYASSTPAVDATGI